MMIGTSGGAGQWVEQDYTPDQCVGIVASILSKRSMEDASKPLLDAIYQRYDETLLNEARALLKRHPLITAEWLVAELEKKAGHLHETTPQAE